MLYELDYGSETLPTKGNRVGFRRLLSDPRYLSFPTILTQCKQNQISFRNLNLVVRGKSNELKQVSPHQYIRCLSIIMCEWLGRRLVNKNEGKHARCAQMRDRGTISALSLLALSCSTQSPSA
jgi:hypothetical protein